MSQAHVANAQGAPALRFDIVAGLTAAAVVLPKAMAYATVAGLPVAVGLYTAFVPMLIYALLGSSRVLSVSSTTTLAILAGTQLGLVVPDGDPAKLITATATLTALVGAMLGEGIKEFLHAISIVRVQVAFNSHSLSTGKGAHTKKPEGSCCLRAFLSVSSSGRLSSYPLVEIFGVPSSCSLRGHEDVVRVLVPPFFRGGYARYGWHSTAYAASSRTTPISFFREHWLHYYNTPAGRQSQTDLRPSFATAQLPWYSGTLVVTVNPAGCPQP